MGYHGYGVLNSNLLLVWKLSLEGSYLKNMLFCLSFLFSNAKLEAKVSFSQVVV